MKKFVTILLVVVVIIAIIVIWKTDKLEVQNSENVAEEVGGASGQFGKLATDALVILSQKPGDMVIASAVNISENGFLVVRRDLGGKAGEIIGVSEFLVAGQYTGIDVGTTESLLDGVSYYGQLYSDDGDGVFDPKSDAEIISKIGVDKAPIYSRFAVDADAPNPQDVPIIY